MLALASSAFDPAQNFIWSTKASLTYGALALFHGISAKAHIPGCDTRSTSPQLHSDPTVYCVGSPGLQYALGDTARHALLEGFRAIFAKVPYQRSGFADGQLQRSVGGRCATTVLRCGDAGRTSRALHMENFTRRPSSDQDGDKCVMPTRRESCRAGEASTTGTFYAALTTVNPNSTTSPSSTLPSGRWFIRKALAAVSPTDEGWF